MDDNKKLMVKIEEYHDRFGKYFPTMDFMNATDKEFITMIDECLEKNKNASEVFDLNYGNDIII